MTDHPSFYTAVHKLQLEQKRTENLILRANRGIQETRKRRSQESRVERRKNIVANFHVEYENDIPRYLRAISHTFKRSMKVGTGSADNSDDNMEDDRDTVEVDRDDN